MENNKTIAVLFLLCSWLFSFSVHGAEKNIERLINSINTQSLLSQNMATAYFFYGLKVNVEKSHKKLHGSIRAFKKNKKALDLLLNSQPIKNKLYPLEADFERYQALITAPFSATNAVMVLSLSERMLATHNDIIGFLRQSNGNKTASSINLSINQQVSAQRIAKFYIAYQSGIKNPIYVKQLAREIQEFDHVQALLMTHKDNTSGALRELRQVERHWFVVKRFYTNVDKAGSPRIVFRTVDKMTAALDYLTRIYKRQRG